MRPVVTLATALVMCFAKVVAQGGLVTAPGDASAGKAIFEGSGACLTCHSVNDRGGSLGPDLSWIGLLRTPESLEQSLIDPDADIARRYFTIVVETRKGQRIEGLALNEDDFSIQIRDVKGDLRSFDKSDLTSVRREPRSLMRSHGPELSPAKIAYLVSYLRTLRTLWPVEGRERTRAIAPATENAAFFNRPERDREERPDLLLEALEITRGATVADIGAGTGYFTWRLAERVGPRGKVYAVDVQQTMLDMTRAAVDRRNLDNVEYLLTTRGSPKAL
jgi:putative heme-binding domain-containing protein